MYVLKPSLGSPHSHRPWLAELHSVGSVGFSVGDSVSSESVYKMLYRLIIINLYFNKSQGIQCDTRSM